MPPAPDTAVLLYCHPPFGAAIGLSIRNQLGKGKLRSNLPYFVLPFLIVASSSSENGKVISFLQQTVGHRQWRSCRWTCSSFCGSFCTACLAKGLSKSVTTGLFAPCKRSPAEFVGSSSHRRPTTSETDHPTTASASYRPCVPLPATTAPRSNVASPALAVPPAFADALALRCDLPFPRSLFAYHSLFSSHAPFTQPIAQIARFITCPVTMNTLVDFGGLFDASDSRTGSPAHPSTAPVQQ